MRCSAYRLINLLRAASLISLMLFVALLSALFTQPAFASAESDVASRAYSRQVSCTGVNITAQVESDAALRVSEQRTFILGGKAAGATATKGSAGDDSRSSAADGSQGSMANISPVAISWPLDGFPPDSSVRIEGVRIAVLDSEGNVSGDWVELPETAFSLRWREEGGAQAQSFSFDAPLDTMYVFLRVPCERVLVEADYSVAGAFGVYADYAELLWRYIPEGWAVDSESVSMRLVLPVPASQVTRAGENVFAWGHGPKTGSLHVKVDGSIVFSDSLVPAGQYAEAHVLFPSEWLFSVSSQMSREHGGDLIFEAALSEEGAWTDSSSVWWQNRYRVYTTIALICAVILLVAMGGYLLFGRERVPDFTGRYWRGSPCDFDGLADAAVPVAVLGRLWRWNRKSVCDIAATAAHLAQRGCFHVVPGTYVGPQGELVRDYYLVKSAQADDAALDPIDKATMRLLFDDAAAGAPSLWMATLRERAISDPWEFSRAIRRWQRVLSDTVDEIGLFESAGKRFRGLMFAVAGTSLVLGVGASALMVSLVPAMLLISTSVGIAVLANHTQRRTELGNNLAARCKASRNWIVDHRRLGENLPDNPALRDEILVLAYLFDVIEAVAEEIPEDQLHLFVGVRYADVVSAERAGISAAASAAPDISAVALSAGASSAGSAAAPAMSAVDALFGNISSAIIYAQEAQSPTSPRKARAGERLKRVKRKRQVTSKQAASGRQTVRTLPAASQAAASQQTVSDQLASKR